MYTLAAGSGAVGFGLPPASLLKFPPDDLPDVFAPPQLAEPTWYQPFNIPTTLYHQLLDIRVPLTIAGVYATTVILLNRVNASRGFKPYAFSKTTLFKYFVILHNIFLAVYSTWTFVGMLRAFRASWPRKDEPHGLLAVTDTMCRFSGPHGYGNGVMYNDTSKQWTYANPLLKMGPSGVPDSTEPGRVWNEGLAFLGWIFYLSKFYEVFDTAIILAKGKKSSTLQTYHHTGAMMCMWAGIRYMATPIWIFTQVNSGIHALMYTYYTLSALGVRVPTMFKRSLTSMQIAQFVAGCSMAASYLFIHYTVPFPRTVSAAMSAASSALQANAAAATASDNGFVPEMKKLALRAAGAAGIAENVANEQPSATGVAAAAATKAAAAGVPDVDYRMVSCLDTSGQGIAVCLNVMYLLPLTYLFVQFFIRSYLYSKDPGAGRPAPMNAAEKAGIDALKGVSREMHKAVNDRGDEKNGRA